MAAARFRVVSLVRCVRLAPPPYGPCSDTADSYTERTQFLDFNEFSVLRRLSIRSQEACS